MNVDPSNCPFCNGVLPPLSAPAAADKLPCPRCGELVPATRWHVDTSIASGEPKPPLPVPDVPRSDPPGTRKTALIILGVMVAMAIIGLSYALWTTKLRRARDPKLLLDPLVIRKPIQLSGLGYLPKDSHFIAGLHIAEMMADKAVGRPLFDEPRPLLLDWLARQLPRLSGMSLEEIDHVVLAASLDTMQLTLVVKTRRAYAPEKIVELTRPADAKMYQHQPLYELSLGPAAKALLWCVEEKTLVCVIRLDPPKLEHLRDLPATPRAIDEVVPAPLRVAMEERLPKQDFLWAVGRLDQLGALKDVLPLLPLGKFDLGAVKDVQTFAVAVQPLDGLTLTGHFRMTDVKSAAQFKDFLDTVLIEGATQRVEIPPPDVEQWVSWQVRGDVAVMREWLTRGKK